MVIIHTVQKLLNTSRLEASRYISKANEGQQLHSWYARLLSSSFPGKMMVMYVHEPSLMAIICKGKTIQGTYDNFRARLELLLRRNQFPATWIQKELSQADGYVVSRSSSRSLLAFMNQMVFELDYWCRMAESYEAIPIDELEDKMMGRIYRFGKRFHDYRTPLQYWQQEIGLAQ